MPKMNTPIFLKKKMVNLPFANVIHVKLPYYSSFLDIFFFFLFFSSSEFLVFHSLFSSSSPHVFFFFSSTATNFSDTMSPHEQLQRDQLQAKWDHKEQMRERDNKRAESGMWDRKEMKRESESAREHRTFHMRESLVLIISLEFDVDKG